VTWANAERDSTKDSTGKRQRGVLQVGVTCSVIASCLTIAVGKLATPRIDPGALRRLILCPPRQRDHRAASVDRG
jgi:hypothetical protein